MAFLQVGYFSSVLGLHCSMNVILPQPAPAVRGRRAPARRPLPVLYLLHGYSDDHTMWIRHTSLERYAARYRLGLVLPNANLSFYTDMVHGQRYETFISEELPAIVTGLFHVSPRREDTFVAGLSMGGYGALRLAFDYPERFGAAAAIGGVVDLGSPLFDETEPVFRQQLRNIFGDTRRLKGSAHDLFTLASRHARKGTSLPRLYQCCATGDYLYADNLRFRDHLRKLGLACTYAEGPGLHNWAYYDAAVQDVLDWLPLPENRE